MKILHYFFSFMHFKLKKANTIESGLIITLFLKIT
jgi:hypothetical protein